MKRKKGAAKFFTKPKELNIEARIELISQQRTDCIRQILYYERKEEYYKNRIKAELDKGTPLCAPRLRELARRGLAYNDEAKNLEQFRTHLDYFLDRLIKYKKLDIVYVQK